MNRELHLMEAFEGALSLIDLKTAPDWFVIMARQTQALIQSGRLDAEIQTSLDNYAKDDPLMSNPEIVAAAKAAIARNPSWQAKSADLSSQPLVGVIPEKTGLTVSVCHLSDGDDPFVFECHGRVTASVLADIDRDLLENRDTHFPDGPGDYEFSLTWYKGQYGFEGRCELAPGWEFEQIGFKPLALPPADEFPHTEVEVSGHKFLVVDLPTTFFDEKPAHGTPTQGVDHG